jgi:hypothetical protein
LLSLPLAQTSTPMLDKATQKEEILRERNPRYSCYWRVLKLNRVMYKWAAVKTHVDNMYVERTDGCGWDIKVIYVHKLIIDGEGFLHNSTKRLLVTGYQ